MCTLSWAQSHVEIVNFLPDLRDCVPICLFVIYPGNDTLIVVSTKCLKKGLVKQQGDDSEEIKTHKLLSLFIVIGRFASLNDHLLHLHFFGFE